MGLLVSLLPCFFLGSIGMLLTLIGGSVKQQTFGQLAGPFIFAIILIPWFQPQLDFLSVAVGFASGLTGAAGIMLQLYSFKLIGISRTMPVSTGLQLVFMALAGVLFFGEWRALPALIAGSIAIVAICGGIYLTAYTEKSLQPHLDPALMRRSLVINFISALLLAAYLLEIQWAGVVFQDFFLPQTAGMLVAALILGYAWRDGTSLWQAPCLRLVLIPGLVFGVGLLLLQISTALNGVAAGFTLSQLGVVVSVATGILVLKEHKTPMQMRLTALGIVLILVGAALIGYSKTF